VDADVGPAEPDEQCEPDDAGGTAGHGFEPIDRAGALRVLDEVDAELGDIETALRRLDDGTYGTCEACGRTIAEDRLQAAPAARLCPEHLP
jgi:RNA polymerase-binding transcription factor DksA